MTKYQAILWQDGVQKEVHNFELVYSQKGWYRSTTSISAFRERESTRLYNHTIKKGGFNLPGKRCHIRFGADIEFFNESQRMLKELIGEYTDPYDNLPQFSHSSVWDFYKAIGYDYKKKRYIS